MSWEGSTLVTAHNGKPAVRIQRAYWRNRVAALCKPPRAHSKLLVGLLKEDLGHHPLVLVIQQMTMKYRHTLDDGVGEVEDDFNGAARTGHSRYPPMLAGGVARHSLRKPKSEPGGCGKDAVRQFC